jgi:hypothetical protein
VAQNKRDGTKILARCDWQWLLVREDDAKTRHNKTIVPKQPWQTKLYRTASPIFLCRELLPNEHPPNKLCHINHTNNSLSNKNNPIQTNKHKPTLHKHAIPTKTKKNNS